MFSTAGLFQNTPCPQGSSCSRPSCLFSHASPPPRQQELYFPTIARPITSNSSSVLSKRPSSLISSSPSTSQSSTTTSEPPRKQIRTNVSTARPSASASQPTTGIPTLRVNAAQSQVAIPVRQAMIKTMYEHFVVLYGKLLGENPTIASEHTLKQEAEVYSASSKTTYKNAMINSIVALKRRVIPDGVNHPSVGTEAEVLSRATKKKTLKDLKVTRDKVKSLVMSLEMMEKANYMTSLPIGVGSDRSSAQGEKVKCERCQQDFRVDANFGPKDCFYHWGRLRFTRIAGERQAIFSCCNNLNTEGSGCVYGPHVFYESDPELLHARHKFSYTKTAAADKQTALDVVALDCEMVYTSGGLRVARVSVVDGEGTQVFDEFVRMDDDVFILDFNTRFSGVTPEKYSTATLTLASIRQALDALIDSNTIIIGHALDNDLKTLRMLHFQCVDTAILFPHKNGLPLRRALRDLVKEKLDSVIQSAGAAGHSSVEDSVAALDLVRWHILNTQRR